MSTDFTDTPPEPGPPTGIKEGPQTGIVRLPRGHPAIAWAVILAAVAGVFLLQFFRASSEGQQIDIFEIQARALVGAADLGPGRSQIYKQAQELDRGPAAQRLGFAVLAGELKGPDEALDRLNDLKDLLDKGETPQTSPEEAAAGPCHGRNPRPALPRLFARRPVGGERRRGGTRSDATAARLVWRPGPQPARRAEPRRTGRGPGAGRALVRGGRAGDAGAASGAGVNGFLLLVLFLALWRWMHNRFTTGSAHGGVYAETFALWLIVYFGLGRAAAALPAGLPLAVTAGVPQLLSLGVLGWPVLRGAPWRQVRRDIGWWAGDRPALEPFYGIVCYLAALPLVILAALSDPCRHATSCRSSRRDDLLLAPTAPRRTPSFLKCPTRAGRFGFRSYSSPASWRRSWKRPCSAASSTATCAWPPAAWAAFGAWS